MKKLKNIAISFALALSSLLSLSGCHTVETWDNDLYGNFDALWTIIDEHYCFFEYKNIDWEAIRIRYRSEIQPDWKAEQLFAHCAAMLDELQDGHTNLISWFDVSYYRKWWTDYPQNFDLRLVQQYYLDFDYHSGGGMIYKYLTEPNVGYMRYSTFSSGFSDVFVDNMLYSMKDADGLIIDIRDNGGGEVTNVEKLVAHFISEPILAGYICHKTGPGHDDFSEPYAYNIDPAEQHVRWLKPVVILTNRSTYSAANDFVSIMKYLPHVAIVGDRTGGGCGMPFTSEIPCGWAVRFSAVPMYDKYMNLTEFGIEPTRGCKVDMNPEEALTGHDTILDFAINLIQSQVEARR